MRFMAWQMLHQLQSTKEISENLTYAPRNTWLKCRKLAQLPLLLILQKLFMEIILHSEA